MRWQTLSFSPFSNIESIALATSLQNRLEALAGDGETMAMAPYRMVHARLQRPNCEQQPHEPNMFMAFGQRREILHSALQGMQNYGAVKSPSSLQFPQTKSGASDRRKQVSLRARLSFVIIAEVRLLDACSAFILPWDENKAARCTHRRSLILIDEYRSSHIPSTMKRLRRPGRCPSQPGASSLKSLLKCTKSCTIYAQDACRKLRNTPQIRPAIDPTSGRNRTGTATKFNKHTKGQNR